MILWLVPFAFMITVYKTHAQKQREEQARASMGLCDGVRPYSLAKHSVKSWELLHRWTGSRKNLTATGYWGEQKLRRTEQGVNWECLDSAVRPAMQSCRRLHTLQCSAAWYVADDASLAFQGCSYGTVVLWNSSGNRDPHVLAQTVSPLWQSGNTYWGLHGRRQQRRNQEKLVGRSM